MNDLNLIVLNSNFDMPNSELKEVLFRLPAKVHIVTQEDFISHPTAIEKANNLFLFDDNSLATQAIRNLISKHLCCSPQQNNVCLIFGAAILMQETEFFSAFKDFLIWPCSTEEIRARLIKFLQPKNQAFVQKHLTQQLKDEHKLLEEFADLQLTGASPIFIKTISLIKKISSCHASVLIQGETGTGKENAARAIHYLSDRRNNAFIPINCAAIPDELLESELFGHEKGAFTDAKTTQTGLIGLAQCGTLFLDEVDSLTPKAQAALLRFLQTQEYRPLGSKVTLQADVRILAATNADLKQLASQKLFREDLYFRLNVLNVEMPALRQRCQDIPSIAEALIKKFAQQYRCEIKKIHPFTLDYLKQQSWPGNIRELENIILRHFLLSNETTLYIESEHAFGAEPFVYAPSEPAEKKQLNFQNAKANAINNFEESYLKELMTLAGGNVSAAARIAGKERRALGRLLQKHHIQKSSAAILSADL